MQKACVIGHPIRHSRSPLIHGRWIREHGIAAEYGKQDVTPENFAAFMAELPAMGYVGGNATLPHKTALLALARVRSKAAEAAGAANMFWFENGLLHADNTDTEGFLANLDHGAPGWDQPAECALVLGAGGASRAIVYGLVSRGFDRILIANRTRTNAEALRDRFGERVIPIDWDVIETHLPDVDVLVNSTSLGMVGQAALTLSLGALPPHAVVTDAVYVPLETDLLVRARVRNLRTVGGLGMLLHQAVPGFERWFGVRPQVTEDLHTAIAADVEAAR